MFYQNLRNLRESDSLSQNQFAQKIGFSQSAVSAWENNTREPGIGALIKISQFFNVSVDYLIGNSSAPLEIKMQKKLSPDEQNLLNVFRKLTSYNRIKVSSYAEIRLEEQLETSAN